MTVPAGKDYLITGTGASTSNQITIENGATVTLRNVNISSAASCILCNGNATIILEDGTTNTLTSGGGDGINPALRVGDKDYTLTIKGETAGTGKLIAQGANNSAGIGGGNNNGDRTCGDIDIQGGIIEAKGGAHAAGIGADLSSNCGNITISGGTVTATGGNFAAGIGSGDVTSPVSICGDITISGGTVTATGGQGAAGIGCGQGVEDQSNTCGNITISGGIVIATGGEGAPAIGSGDGVTISESNHKSVCGTITITDGVTRVIATRGTNAPHCIGKGASESTCCTVTIGGVEYGDGADDETYLSRDKLTVAGINSASVNLENTQMSSGEFWLVIGNGVSTSNQIRIADGATVALSNVNISNTAWCILSNGNATIILKDGTTNTLTCSTSTSTTNNHAYPAIWVGDTGTLTIKGETESTGELTAQGGDGCAAIGGGYNNTNKASGNIEVQGGIIIAMGGANAPGIGADYNGKCGNITITNGVNRLIAIKGSNAPHCIGRGYGSSSTCGTVKINGIEYWNGSYQKDGATYLNQSKITLAGINSGSVNPGATETPEMQSGELWLVMGDVTPTSNQIWITNGATVALSNVNISNEAFGICCTGDATVILAEGTTNTLTTSTAQLQYTYPALWVGNSGKTLTIKGTGSLTAQGGYERAAIGGGYNNNNKTCGNIVIEDGVIDATGGVGAAGIGADFKSICGDITISGGNITAKGGSSAPGIGSGNSGSEYGADSRCGTITITNDVTRLIATKGTTDATHCIGKGAGDYAYCGTITIGGVEYWNGTAIYQNNGDNYITKNTLAFLKANRGATDSEYWTTFCYSGDNLQASEGTQVFKAALIDNTIKLSEITDRIVNDGQGVILKSSSPNFLMTASDNGTTSDGGYEGNSLKPATTTITNPVNAYVLNKGEGGVGFYKLGANGIIAAGKAYLTYTPSSTNPARQFFLFDEATGIKSIDHSPLTIDHSVYDMQGRRVANGQSLKKGLYIVNGKKVIK